MDDTRASRTAAAANIIAPPLANYYLGEPTQRGLILGYTGVGEAEIEPGVQRLASGLTTHRGREIK